MSRESNFKPTRRAFMAGSAALIGAPALGQDPLEALEEAPAYDPLRPPPEPEPPVRRNISSFRTADWKTHFSNLKNGAILVDTQSRALHYWSEDESIYRLYPSSVPLTEEMKRRGRTNWVRKV